MVIKWGIVIQGLGYTTVGLLLLSVRAQRFAPTEEVPVAMQAALVGNSETYSNQQLKAGQNLLSNLVLTRATYLLEVAQRQPNATQWLEQHRGATLGSLRAADTQRGGIWRGTAEDNAMAPVVVESLAIELARTWISTKRATPMANHSFANYLASARMAGSNGRYDPATMELYLAALGLVGEGVAPLGLVEDAPQLQPEAAVESMPEPGLEDGEVAREP